MLALKSLKSLLLVSCLLLLAGCGNFLSSKVVTFHEGSLPNGETIRIRAMDESKAKSLEFRSYAALISEQLRKIGYTPVDAADARAELIADVDYDIKMGPAELRVDRDVPYVRYHFYYGRYADPFYFGLDRNWNPDIYTVSNYERTLKMNIVKAGPEEERIFEGRVQSSGKQNNLPEIMPYLITAMFSNFPGESGVTKVVTIEMDE